MRDRGRDRCAGSHRARHPRALPGLRPGPRSPPAGPERRPRRPPATGLRHPRGARAPGRLRPWGGMDSRPAPRCAWSDALALARRHLRRRGPAHQPALARRPSSSSCRAQPGATLRLLTTRVRTRSGLAIGIRPGERRRGVRARSAFRRDPSPSTAADASPRNPAGSPPNSAAANKPPLRERPRKDDRRAARVREALSGGVGMTLVRIREPISERLGGYRRSLPKRCGARPKGHRGPSTRRRTVASAPSGRDQAVTTRALDERALRTTQPAADAAGCPQGFRLRSLPGIPVLGFLGARGA
jgi:hypothetical protein